MAQNEPRVMTWVRDLYEGLDRDKMDKAENDQHIKETLKKNPDVLFRVYKKGKLDMVMFRPSDPVVWMNVMWRRINGNLSFQMNNSENVNDYTIILSKSPEELERFCNDFDQMHEEATKNMRESGGAQGNPEDDVEQLGEKFSKLDTKQKK